MVLFSLYSAERAVVMATLVDDVIIHKQIPAAFQSAAIQGFFWRGFHGCGLVLKSFFFFPTCGHALYKNKAANQVEPSGCHTPASYFIYFIHFFSFSPQRLRIIFFHDYVFKCGQSVSVCVCVCRIGEMYQPRATRTLYCSM